MDMVPTLDILLSDPAATKERLALVARAAVAAAVADWSALRALQRELRPGDWLAGEEASVAVAFHRQHEAWLPAARALGQRVAVVAERVGPVAGSEQLADAIGLTTARLSVSVADTITSIRAGHDGRERHFASVEDMRRELLQPVNNRPRAGPVPEPDPVAAGGRA